MRSMLMVFALLAVAWAHANPFSPMPPNSFLVRPVNSVKELVQQIRSEPVVAQRYARHFGQPAYLLADFFEKNLRLTKLERTQEFLVYYAPPDGRLLVKRRWLPRGKEVFALKNNNKPLLVVECGNPLTAVVDITPRPVVETAAVPLATSRPNPVITAEISQPILPEVEIVEVPLEEVVAADLFPPAILSELELLPEVAPEPPPVIAPMAVTPTVPAAPALYPASALWVVIPLIPFLVPKGNVIPEPSTWMGLIVGLGMLYSLTGKAFRRVRNSSQRGESSR